MINRFFRRLWKLWDDLFLSNREWDMKYYPHLYDHLIEKKREQNNINTSNEK